MMRANLVRLDSDEDEAGGLILNTGEGLGARELGDVDDDEDDFSVSRAMMNPFSPNFTSRPASRAWSRTPTTTRSVMPPKFLLFEKYQSA